MFVMDELRHVAAVVVLVALFSVEPGGGDDTGQTSGIVTGQFEVEGNSSGGARVTITGSFTGNYTAGVAVTDPEGNVVEVQRWHGD